MIDICDLAVGLSRQLHGLTIATERPGHRMMEQWHPLGVVGVISAFNFPVAVWSWNSTLAFVCGDSVVWKPSEKTVLTALACQALLAEAARRVGAPEHLSSVVIGERTVGEALVDDPRVAARVGHRLDPDGQGGRTARGRPPGPLAARARRQQRRHRGAAAPTSTSRCGASCSPRSARPGSAARRCAGSSRTSRSATTWSARLRAAYETLPIGSPLEPSHAGRPADRRERLPTRSARRSRRPRPTAARSSPAAPGTSRAIDRRRATTCTRRSSTCPSRPRSSRPRRSRRCSTC